jgi:hypothetical protein
MVYVGLGVWFVKSNGLSQVLAFLVDSGLIELKYLEKYWDCM